ncbi:MAG: hypothetical protein DMF10_07540 [Verrucomicrobia bacterium]|nr:MAG: hypothetical protein DMF10_07540 [Verrucomicrobiota bacterium]
MLFLVAAKSAPSVRATGAFLSARQPMWALFLPRAAAHQEHRPFECIVLPLVPALGEPILCYGREGQAFSKRLLAFLTRAASPLRQKWLPRETVKLGR